MCCTTGNEAASCAGNIRGGHGHECANKYSTYKAKEYYFSINLSITPRTFSVLIIFILLSQVSRVKPHLNNCKSSRAVRVPDPTPRVFAGPDQPPNKSDMSIPRPGT